jgi:hypothetical protein
MQVVVYCVTLAVIFMLSKLFSPPRRQRAAASAGA